MNVLKTMESESRINAVLHPGSAYIPLVRLEKNQGLWIRTLIKFPIGGLLWRKCLSLAGAGKRPGDAGGKCPGVGVPYGPLKGGPWLCEGLNGGGP